MNKSQTKLHTSRGLSLLLAGLLVLCLLPVRARAASGTTGDLSWSLSGGTLSITGKGDMPDYSDGAMAPWFGSGAAITRISVGEGVSSIGELAFYGCGRVTAVTLPAALVEGVLPGLGHGVRQGHCRQGRALIEGPVRHC